MDILAQNIQTGEIKNLPPKVFEANRSKWRRIEMAAKDEPLEVPKNNEAGLSQSPIITSVADLSSAIENPTKDFLQSEYEALSGEKPDGRWSEKKLAQKIQELKDNK